MASERITEKMGTIDIVEVMSDGNIDAFICMFKMLHYYRSFAILDIFFLDSLGIYGSKMGKLWNDCCNKDINKLMKTIWILRSGRFSAEDIHRNLNSDHIVPYV